jgi:hypothetical protein
MNNSLNSVTLDFVLKLWIDFINFMPTLILGFLILIFGWLFAVGVGKIVGEVLKKMKFDRVFEKEGWKEAMDKAKIKISASLFVGTITKWILFIVFLWAALGTWGLAHFASFMEKIIDYIPNVIVASLIFVVAVILADFLAKIIVASTEKANFTHTHLAGEIVRWSIWIFAIFAILIELKIATELLSTLFTGVVALFVIAGGLAFGLGGKDTAAEFLHDFRKKLKG